MASRTAKPTEGSFMISTSEYWKLVYAKARLEVLKETYERYDTIEGVTEFLDTCRRTFHQMDEENGVEHE